jgi:hypothetical protein
VPLLMRGNIAQEHLARGFAEFGSPSFYAGAFTAILALFGSIKRITPVSPAIRKFL